MVRAVLKVILVVALVALTACGGNRGYNGPPVTAIEVHKADRKMYLLSGNTLLKTYKIHLGGAPVGPKHFEGDGKTPEGAYLITHRNPNSAYHLSLGISYPNDADRAYAATYNLAPGGDIFIHGQTKRVSTRGDWTVGCIAVTDRQIEEIYAMVNPGTVIRIFP
ncbi:MAG: L,D-transpeptidase family protein [bacterium]